MKANFSPSERGRSSSARSLSQTEPRAFQANSRADGTVAGVPRRRSVGRTRSADPRRAAGPSVESSRVVVVAGPIVPPLQHASAPVGTSEPDLPPVLDGLESGRIGVFDEPRFPGREPFLGDEEATPSHHGEEEASRRPDRPGRGDRPPTSPAEEQAAAGDGPGQVLGIPVVVGAVVDFRLRATCPGRGRPRRGIPVDSGGPSMAHARRSGRPRRGSAIDPGGRERLGRLTRFPTAVTVDRTPSISAHRA